MNGPMFLFSLYAFMAWRGAAVSASAVIRLWAASLRNRASVPGCLSILFLFRASSPSL